MNTAQNGGKLAFNVLISSNKISGGRCLTICGRISCITSTQLKQQKRALTLPGPLKRGKVAQEYAERRLLGYSMEQMYHVVSDVQNYRLFVPWCLRSDVITRQDRGFHARLRVGFPPVLESYTSVVTLEKPRVVKSVVKDTRLFSHLNTTWKFSPGLPNNSHSCTLHFDVSFQFKSSFYSKLSHLFFDEVVKTMVGSFLQRAHALYGPPSIKTQPPTVLISTR